MLFATLIQSFAPLGIPHVSLKPRRVVSAADPGKSRSICHGENLNDNAKRTYSRVAVDPVRRVILDPDNPR